ncbi:hypothetical protein KUL156_12180 [Alteromonas sp. KUL156]|nr:hypothetical protein KUL118_52690 [Tenacibaculum sp. KUL118]GFD91769.1 hypothetical protein KUL154_05020 [Alteromonas sp. KUL154]GFD98625.1 hypothetical protein KUL156_12180 [Alteromonas sp. KUL156]
MRWNVGATCEGKRYSTSANVFFNGATADDKAVSCATADVVDREVKAHALATTIASLVIRLIIVYPFFGGILIYQA